MRVFFFSKILVLAIPLNQAKFCLAVIILFKIKTIYKKL
jgi:hypothetical protein